VSAVANGDHRAGARADDHPGWPNDPPRWTTWRSAATPRPVIYCAHKNPSLITKRYMAPPHATVPVPEAVLVALFAGFACCATFGDRGTTSRVGPAFPTVAAACRIYPNPQLSIRTSEEEPRPIPFCEEAKKVL
jgi:hypothetical protein